MTDEWTDTIAEQARQRFAKWDAAMWREVVDGPAARLAGALDEAGLPVDQSRPVLEAYLEFAAEAIGLGYIYPVDETGRKNFFNRAWFELLPEDLPRFEPDRQMELLAVCWNLGENLETRPAWLQHLLMDHSALLETLDSFEARVEAATAEILGEPQTTLADAARSDEGTRIEWLYMGGHDPRFLPGAVEFLAPGVVCIHHRHEGLDGRPKSSIGVSLLGEPEVLGTMQLTDPDVATEVDDDGFWKGITSRDGRVTGMSGAARNAWRGVCTLNTSQFAVAVLPAEPNGGR